MSVDASDFLDEVMDALQRAGVLPEYNDRESDCAPSLDAALAAIEKLVSQRRGLAEAVEAISAADGDHYTDAPECAAAVTRFQDSISNAATLADVFMARNPVLVDDDERKQASLACISGLAFDDVTKFFAARNAEDFAVGLARDQWHEAGKVEVDDNAVVSEGADNGAFVLAWVWADYAGTEFDKERAPDDEDDGDDTE